MIDRHRIKNRLEKQLPPSFQKPITAYLGTTDDGVDVMKTTNVAYVRIGDYDSPEVDTALVDPFFLSYYASVWRHNLKLELKRTERGDLYVSGIDIYAVIANFGGVPMSPRIVIDVGSDHVTGILAVDHGGSGADLSATGAATHFVRQATAGAAFSVGAIVSADLTTALTTSPPIGGTTPPAGTFNPLGITTYAQFTEASTPASPANTALRLFGRDVLTFSRLGYVDSLGVIIDVSRDRTIEANNATGSTISALRVCRVNGASGTTPFQPTIIPAQGDSVANADGVLGVTIASITNGSNGRVMLHGLLSIDTSSVGTGAVYIDPTTAGVLTTTKPTAPNVARRVGWVLRANVSGLILIDPGEIDSDTTYSVFTGASAGVAGSTGLVPQPLAGQQNRILTGDGTWKATMDAVVIGGTTPAAATVTAFNTTGQVVFNDAAADVDFRVEGDTDANLFFADASTDRIGIGTNTPGVKLDVVGSTTISPDSNTTNTFATNGAVTFKYQSNLAYPTLGLYRTRASNAAVQTNDILGAVHFKSMGDSEQIRAIIHAVATANHDASIGSTRVEIYTTPAGSETQTLAATFGADGSLTTANYVNVGATYLAVAPGGSAGNSRFWQGSADSMPTFQTAQGLYMALSGKFWALLNTIATSSTSEVSLTSGATWGTLVVPANQCAAGTVIRIKYWGKTVATAGNFYFNFYINASQKISAAIYRTSTGTYPFSIEFHVVVRNTTGSNNLALTVVGSGIDGEVLHVATNPINFDTTAATTFEIKGIWADSPSGQTATLEGAMAIIH